MIPSTVLTLGGEHTHTHTHVKSRRTIKYILMLFSDVYKYFKNLEMGSTSLQAEAIRKDYMIEMQPEVGICRIWIDEGVGRALQGLANNKGTRVEWSAQRA